MLWNAWPKYLALHMCTLLQILPLLFCQNWQFFLHGTSGKQEERTFVLLYLLWGHPTTTWTKRGRQVVSRKSKLDRQNGGEIVSKVQNCPLKGGRWSKLGKIWSTQLLNASCSLSPHTVLLALHSLQIAILYLLLPAWCSF